MKRFMAMFMVLTLGFLMSGGHLAGQNARAASSKKTYIKELKVFTKEDGTEADAENWCAEQKENKDNDKDNDWAVIPGNLNEGASGSLKKEVGVFLCYTTTTSADEAVTDIAVMNEKGNYSVGAYEQILKEQRDMYKDMIDDMKDMLEEYRANYTNKVVTAVQAHDFMNGYIEDDSGKHLGDLLLDITDEELAGILLQANGQVVLMMQEQLAYACDTGKNTWLDRMEKIGSYKALRSKAIKAYNNNTAKADKALNNKYHDQAVALAESWNDISEHFTLIKKMEKSAGFSDMSDKEIIDWLNKYQDLPEVMLYEQELKVVMFLSTFKYEDASLAEFFNQDQEEISGKNIYKLYPLAASLSEGQFAGTNEYVSLYQMIQNAMGATLYNDYQTGKAKVLEENMDSETLKAKEQTKENMNSNLERWNKNYAISIYDGVDRGLFDGNVAVASSAETFSKATDTNWANSFVESGAFSKTAIGLAAGSLISAVGSGILAIASKKAFAAAMNDRTLIRNWLMNRYAGQYKADKIENALNAIMQPPNQVGQDNIMKITKIREEMCRQVADTSIAYRVLKGLKIGLAVVAVLLAVADIVMTSITLYKYYNVEHLPIPNYMVDLSYNEDKETSYISYKSVSDQDGNNGDLNGGGGKQWLALYATHDEDAGNPILAPTGKGGSTDNIFVQTKTEKAGASYQPLHIFGTPNAAQNLTFADGTNGWSYNDNMGGVYLFFTRDEDAFDGTNVDSDSDSEDRGSAGTVVTFGQTIATGGVGVFLGLIIGIFVGVRRKRKTEIERK